MRTVGLIALLGTALTAACAPRETEQATRPEPARVESVYDTSTPLPVHARSLVGDSTVVVRILDVGQGDAALIENGGSRILIDGGPDPRVLGRHLDRLDLNGDTIHVLLITHPHHDHYNGAHALFESARRITVHYVFESRDISPNVTLANLRDSILARAARGDLIYRDTDDPCGDGKPICTVTMRGGARLHVLRPYPSGSTPNNRTTPAKLLAADSASFTMWFGGDAEHEALEWYDVADYDERPGMKAAVLKGNHHGSCNGISARYFELVAPEAVTFSLAAANQYGHMHEQTKLLLQSAGTPWYRTDQNGDITIVSPAAAGQGYSIHVARGTANEPGPSDRASTQPACRM